MTQASIEAKRKQSTLAQLVIKLSGQMTRDQMHQLLSSKFPDSIVKNEGTSLEIDGMSLQYEGSKLIRIVDLSSSTNSPKAQ
jgi:hypothetical protein